MLVRREDMSTGDLQRKEKGPLLDSVTDVLLLTQTPLWIKKPRGKGAQGKNGGPQGNSEKFCFRIITRCPRFPFVSDLSNTLLLTPSLHAPTF